MLNEIEIRGVGRQEFLGAAGPFNEVAGFSGLVEDRHQTVLDIRFEERGIARTLEHKGAMRGW